MLRIPATIHKIETMEDKSLKLHVYTQELSNQEKADIFSLYDVLGYLFFSPSSQYEPDLKDLPPLVLEAKEKSPSERLRAVLFVYFKEKNIQDDFDSFYKKYLNKVIESVKEKLT